ncbi:MAG: TonB-dependent receptor [Mariniphaga sp.]|nr:TonB-dependent receptor [Mariniphaga sp.]
MKKTILVTAILAVFFLFPLAILAQGTITGRVLDTSSQEPLIGATVVLEGTTRGTPTSLDGTFSFRIPAGENTLVVSFIGYITQTVEVNVRNNETKDLGDISLESNTVGLDEILITSSFAKDRQTPVSMSTIQPAYIEERLGSQEFPEILKMTPSIYVTKDNGGYGDSRISLRGFDTYNVGVLINGIPVNDMENSKVYWSNWSGLSDVTQTTQVQRGLGASKLGLSSVGGTYNIITKSTDAEEGGSIYAGIGNSGYRKQAFNVSTGLLENGWAITLSGSHTYGDGYIRGTAFDAYSYFASISKRINSQHRLSLTVFGSPQTHNQRGNRHTIEYYRNHKDGVIANSDFGFREGKVFGGGYGFNYYHKPQGSLNHYWNINDKTLWTNVLYVSLGRGGGRRIRGTQASWLTVDYNTGLDDPNIKRTAEGFLDYNAVAEANRASLDGSQAIVASAVNSHNWYGLLSTLTTEKLGIDWTAGFDGRYYLGFHTEEVIDLLGGQFFMGNMAGDNINQPNDVKLKEGDKFSYDNPGEVIWAGGFLQGEYVADQYSAFLSLAVSNKSYRRTDYFQYLPGNQKTDWQNFLPWNIKGGVNYNINSKHNVYANAGYIKREPVYTNVFLNYTNSINEKVKYETVITGEIGYGFTSKLFNFKANYYYTNWLDKALVRSFGQAGTANIPGINALHQGVEVEATYIPTPKLTLRGMLSLGDWIWQDDVSFTLYDEAQNVLGTYNAYLSGVHVGNSAQSTASLSADYEVLPGMKIGVDYLYLAKNFADFNPINRTNSNDKVDSWQMPNVGLVDLFMNYKFKVAGMDARLFGKVNNLLNTEYVADATDGATHNEKSALVYYGFGTTWSTGLSIYF